MRALAGERVTGHEMLIRRPDGAQLSVSVSAMPVPGADGRPARVAAVSVDAPAPLMLHTDRGRLLQILGHLLTNAVKYTLAGSVTVRVRFDGPYPTFRVEDTGIGVPADQREAIFEEFFRVGRTHRPMGEGRGLGLAISRRVARRLGGELFADDRPGGGSVFILRLPPEVVAGAEESSAAGM